MHTMHRHVIAMLLGAAMLGACDVRLGHFDEDKRRALDGVDTFRILREQQEYARLYELTAPTMKAVVPKDQFIVAAQLAMADLGKYKSSVLVLSSCFPQQVRLVYDAEYERATVREFMIWSVPGDRAELARYEVSFKREAFDKAAQVGCPIP